MISDKKIYEILGARIKEQREGNETRPKLTQAELALKIGLERTSITNIEKGTQKIPLHVLYRLCDVLKIEISTILPSMEDSQEDLSRDVKVGEVTTKLAPRAAQVLENIMSSGKVDKEES